MLRIMKINVSFCYMKDIFSHRHRSVHFPISHEIQVRVYRLGNHTCTFMITISGHTVPLDNRKLPVDRLGNHTCIFMITISGHTVPRDNRKLPVDRTVVVISLER